MKKSLLSFAFAAFAAVSAMAATETLAVNTGAFWGVEEPTGSSGAAQYVNVGDTGSKTQGAITLTWDKNGATTTPRLFNHSSGLQWRLYKNTTISVGTSTGKITGITFENAGSNISSVNGVLENGGWNGEATTVNVTVTGKNVSITRIIVSYEDGDQPAATVETPVIEGTTPFTGSTDVTITCATEGAQIFYTTDGSEPTENSTLYTAPFAISEACTVKAIAFDANGGKSQVASKAFEVAPEEITVPNIAAFYELEKGTKFTFGGLVSAIAQVGNYLYVQDETAGLLIYGKINQEYNMGDVIPAGWQATKAEYAGAAQAGSPSGLEASQDNHELVPVEVSPANAGEYLHQYIVIKDATIAEEGASASTADGEITMFNRRFNTTLPEDLSKQFDVYAVSGYYNAVQIYPIKFVEAESTAINDINVENAKVYKTIENGQVIIVKGAVRYNTMGQIVK